MKQTFYDVITELGPNTALSVNLYCKMLVWSVDFEKQWFFLYDEIPKDAHYFWANRFGKKGKLFRYERVGANWILAETGKPLSREAISRIKCGPAFKEVPPVLNPPAYVSWIM